MGQSPILGQSQHVGGKPPSFGGQYQPLMSQPNQQNPHLEQLLPPSRGEIPSQDIQPIPFVGPSQQIWGPSKSKE